MPSVDVTGLMTGWPLVKVVLCYAFCPYVALWLAVRCFPKGDPRRDEYLGEYEHVPVWNRPFFVGGQVARCVTDGLALRGTRWRTARTNRLAGSVPMKIKPSRIWVTGYRHAMMPPLCFFLGLPWLFPLAFVPMDWSFLGEDDGATLLFFGAGAMYCYWIGLMQVQGFCELLYRRQQWMKSRAIRRIEITSEVDGSRLAG